VVKSSAVQATHLEAFASEFIGAAVLVGLSLVILMFGSGSPIVRVVPSEGLRRLITGFCFGTTGALIALSPVGKVSGAHINPVVTLGFRLMGKMQSGLAAGYVISQFVGATVVRCRFYCGVRWAGALHLGPRFRAKAILSKWCCWAKW
jgi:glycerol uptake facilitator-like aquaporin